MMNGIDGFNALEDVFNRVFHRVLAGFYRKAFVTHILQGDYLSPYLFLSQFFARDVLVFEMVGAVKAAVHAVI